MLRAIANTSCIMLLSKRLHMTRSPAAHQRFCVQRFPLPICAGKIERRDLPQKRTSSAVRSTTAQKVDGILGQRLASLRLDNLDTEAIEPTDHFLFEERN